MILRFSFPILLLFLLVLPGKAQPPSWLVYEITDTINAIADDGDFVWMATRTEGLLKTRKSTGQTASFGIAFGVPDLYVYDLELDEDGGVWAGTKKGVVVFGSSETEVRDVTNSPLPHNEVRTLALGNGAAWFGTPAGLARLNASGWTLFSTADATLPDDEIRSLTFQDTVLWVGMQKGGLARFDTGWTFFNDTNSALSHNSIWSLASDNNGNIWAGTANGLNRFDGTSWTHFTQQNSTLATNWINNISVDGNQNIWLATHSGLSIFDGTVFTNFSQSNAELPTQTAEDVFIDAQGDAWIGMFEGALVAYNPEGVTAAARGKIEYTIGPNPFTEQTTLEISNPKTADALYTLSFYDLTGRKVGEVLDFSGPSISLAQVDLPPGIVLYTLQTNEGSIGRGKLLIFPLSVP